MDKAPIQIVLDDRERDGCLREALVSHADVSLSIDRLPLGDLQVGGRFLVERKTLDDFVKSLVDGRLFDQAVRLASVRDAGKWMPLVILEGQARSARKLNVRREALQGAMVTLSVIFGIPVLRSSGPEETVRLALYSARQALRHWGPLPPSRPGYRPKTKKKRQLFILQGLPGVGRDRAETLLKNFGSVSGVVGASEQDLSGLPGIGPETAKKIRNAVREHPAPGDFTQ